jgi:hypothetical protein
MPTNAKTKLANCDVLASECTGSENYIKRQTPFQTKKAEISESLQYQSDTIDKSREAAVTRARRGGDARPLRGGAASKS